MTNKPHLSTGVKTLCGSGHSNGNRPVALFIAAAPCSYLVLFQFAVSFNWLLRYSDREKDHVGKMPHVFKTDIEFHIIC